VSISTRGECRMELTMSMKLSLSMRLSGMTGDDLRLGGGGPSAGDLMSTSSPFKSSCSLDGQLGR
jgi:hypothetical protein